MNYTVELSKRVAKVVRRMDRPTRERVQDRLSNLGADPFNPRWSKELTAMKSLRSSRVGGWRILYVVAEDIKVVSVTSIKPRGQAYR